MCRPFPQRTPFPSTPPPPGSERTSATGHIPWDPPGEHRQCGAPEWSVRAAIFLLPTWRWGPQHSLLCATLAQKPNLRRNALFLLFYFWPQQWVLQALLSREETGQKWVHSTSQTQYNSVDNWKVYVAAGSIQYQLQDCRTLRTQRLIQEGIHQPAPLRSSDQP